MDVRFRLVAALVAAAWTLCGCGGGGGGSPPPPAPPPPPPPPTLFSDVTAAAGIQFQHGITEPAFPPGPQVDINDSTFGGVASGDCDNDGDVDLFVTYSDVRPNRLYRNQRVQSGSATFVDTAAASGVAFTRSAALSQNWRHSGPVFVDLDGDGNLDLFLGALYDNEPVKVFKNDGNCVFSDVTAGSGLTNLIADTTFSGGFGDYDLDGDLDLFMSHWGTSDAVYGNRATNSEQLYRNISSGGTIQFENVSVASLVTDITNRTRAWGTVGARCTRFVQAGFQNYDFVFTGTFAHLNNDIWPDLLIVGDFTTSQILLNNGDGTFRDASATDLCAAQQPMGSARGDVDNDGDLDWFTSSIMGEGSQAAQAIGNRFYRNLGVTLAGAGVVDMDDITTTMGVASGGWGWGACFLDIDNDTDLDIFHTNGYYQSPALVANYSIDPSRTFVFNGTSYTEQGATYGLNDTLSGRGVVCADFDNDGDLDIFQTTNRQPNSGLLRENRTAASGRNFLKVDLTGIAPNSEAAGARIYVTINAGGAAQMREVMVGSDNYTSQNPTVQHFGLGAASSVHEVRVVWPWRGGGTVHTADSVMSTVTANQTLSCNQANAPGC